MRRNMRLLPLTAALALAACTAKDAGTDTAATDSAAAGTANEVTITATDYAFESPAEIPAGLTNFKMIVNGKEIHHASLIKLEDGKTFEDLMNGFKTMSPDISFTG